MKLWILRPVQNLDSYDVVDGLIVRAETEQQARALASNECGREGSEFWCEAKTSTCLELSPDGEPGVILRNFVAG